MDVSSARIPLISWIFITPFNLGHVFIINSGLNIGRECNMFYSRLSQLISDKRNLSKSITMNWIRTKVCFALLKSSLLCLRGSRTVCRKVPELECDNDVPHQHAKI